MFVHDWHSSGILLRPVKLIQFYRWVGLGWLVIRGHWSSPSTFGSNKVYDQEKRSPIFNPHTNLETGCKYDKLDLLCKMIQFFSFSAELFARADFMPNHIILGTLNICFRRILDVGRHFYLQKETSTTSSQLGGSHQRATKKWLWPQYSFKIKPSSEYLLIKAETLTALLTKPPIDLSSQIHWLFGASEEKGSSWDKPVAVNRDPP